LFHSQMSFNLFLILAVEIIAEGVKCAYIDGKYLNLSLLDGLRRFCSTHPIECEKSGLENAIANTEEWLKREVPFNFWCSSVDAEIKLQLRNKELLKFGANAAKHHLLRLSKLLENLNIFCEKAGYNFAPQEISAILASMIEEVRSRLHWHSSYILSLLGNIFFAINSIIKVRHANKPTNRVKNMNIPCGVTSGVFEDMYGDILVFKKYDDDRILKYTPVATRHQFWRHHL